jgi:hypothetical protein
MNLRGDTGDAVVSLASVEELTGSGLTENRLEHGGEELVEK